MAGELHQSAVSSVRVTSSSSKVAPFEALSSSSHQGTRQGTRHPQVRWHHYVRAPRAGRPVSQKAPWSKCCSSDAASVWSNFRACEGVLAVEKRQHVGPLTLIVPCAIRPRAATRLGAHTYYSPPRERNTSQTSAVEKATPRRRLWRPHKSEENWGRRVRAVQFRADFLLAAYIRA